MNSLIYKKRPGTSGIRGQLYETKLISLIHFRAKHDDCSKEFYLATNVSDIGAFDDICFKAQVNGLDKPVAVFIQAKHRDNTKILTLNNKNDLAKYFESYLKIRRKFKPSNNDVMFEGNFDDTECLFVIYTNAKGDLTNNLYEGKFASYLDDLIGTGDAGLQPAYQSYDDVELLCKTVMKDEISALARRMAKIMCNEDDDQISMNDELVLRYHVVLAQNVFNVSDIQPEGHRLASLRKDIIDTNDEFLKLFKDTLFTEVLNILKIEEYRKQSLLSLIIDGHLEIRAVQSLFADCFSSGWFGIKGISQSFSQRSKQIYEIESTDAEQILRMIKVPAAFGNKDLTIIGNEKKIEKRLNHLTSRFVDLLEKSKPNHVVTIDKYLEDGFLRLNGGIASAIGNILVLDKNPKLYKFTDDYESLEDLAKMWYKKLKSEIPNLHEYKFDMKVKHFPILSFTYSDYDENLAKDFLNRFLFYTNQADEHHVEDILKKAIEDNHYHEITNFRVRSAAIFLKYHDAIQKWWMKPEEGTYLTKESEIYENALKDTVTEPLINVINMMYAVRNQNIDCTFNENAVNSLNLQGHLSGTVIVTESTALTIAKVKQHLENKGVIVIDMEYILNLSIKDHNTLQTELTTINKDKTIIIVCTNVQKTRICFKILENFANIHDKNIIIVTDKLSVEIVINYFSQADLVNDTRNRLVDLSEESQKSILMNTRVVFQGDDVSLDLIADEASMALVEGEILNKIMHNGKIIIGKSVGNANYDKIKHLYINRHFYPSELDLGESFDNVFRKYIHTADVRFNIRKKNKERISVKTLQDIKDDVVIVFANPGMGKSTLLSHLSIRTKKLDPKVWIIRINLLEYTKIFSKWQEDKTDVDTLESLTFLCQVALSEERSKMNEVKIILGKSEGVVYLKDCTGDEWTVFELKMFLHFYNKKELIFLFDGFDEICPHYVHEALALLKVVENFPQKHKTWITSRTYDKITIILVQQFKKFYEIKHLSRTDQDLYLYTFWITKNVLRELNNDQLQNVYDFITFISNSDKIKTVLKKNGISATQSHKDMSYIKLYYSFILYLKSQLKATSQSVIDALNILSKEYEDNNNILSEFVATPLHLYLLADNFYKEIKDVSKKPNKWGLDNDALNIYESFLEIKLKKIRYEEKNEIDMSKPDNVVSYEKERADVVAKHKKLAAYAVFNQNYLILFDKEVLNEVETMIDILKDGKEKTGIICNIVNDIPVFVHSSIAEYYAIKYICDLIKNIARKDKQKSIWDFILNVMFFQYNFSVLHILDFEIKDDKKLTAVVNKNKNIIFGLLLEQGRDVDYKNCDLKSSLCEAIRYDLRNLAFLFISTLDNNLDETNLMDFINIVIKTNMFIFAVKMECEELIKIIVDHVKRIDPTKLLTLFENLEKFEMNGIADISTDEIVHKLHRHVWTRMDIIPDWGNLAEYSGQIYFI